MDLTLYGYDSCYYCRRVKYVQDELGLTLPERNVLREPGARRELVEALGRGTVPVLRIEQQDGSVRWLPESRDIIRYLRERFSDRQRDGSGKADASPGMPRRIGRWLRGD